MKRSYCIQFFIGIVLTFMLGALRTNVQAAVNFGSGYYTNLCGTGEAATANTCNKGCNPQTGSCTAPEADKPYVIKWTCPGNVQFCRLNESGFAASQNIGDTSCDNTVLMQVYNKNCRTYFGWLCNDANLLDSMTWYSGSCTGSDPTPSGTVSSAPSTTTTPANTAICKELQVTGGNNTQIPATVQFQATAETGTSQYRYFFGDGTNSESASNTASHLYELSGQFTAVALVKDQNGSWVSSPRCETFITVKGTTLETHKSGCSDLFIVDGDNTMAPTTMSVRLTGFDNKGAISKYVLKSSDGQTLENSSGAFQIAFSAPGTYSLTGSVIDSEGKEQTAQTCAATVHALTAALKTQPNTGTPTAFSAAAFASGGIGVVILYYANRITKHTKRTKTQLRTRQGKRRRT